MQRRQDRCGRRQAIRRVRQWPTSAGSRRPPPGRVISIRGRGKSPWWWGSLKKDTTLPGLRGGSPSPTLPASTTTPRELPQHDDSRASLRNRQGESREGEGDLGSNAPSRPGWTQLVRCASRGAGWLHEAEKDRRAKGTPPARGTRNSVRTSQGDLLEAAHPSPAAPPRRSAAR